MLIVTYRWHTEMTSFSNPAASQPLYERFRPEAISA